jgi:hypothetical protein
MKIGKAEFEFLSLNQPYLGKPMSVVANGPAEQTGLISKFRVTTTDQLDLVAGVITWPNALPEVKALEMTKGEEKYERLVGSGRLSLLTDIDGKWLGQLRAMKFNPVSRKDNLASITLEQLQVFSQNEFLPAINARAKVGTRAELANETNKNAGSLAFLCDANDVTACAIAYTTTRVLAVMYDYGRN